MGSGSIRDFSRTHEIEKSRIQRWQKLITRHTTLISYNSGKYADFPAHYAYYDGFRAIIWKKIRVIPITMGNVAG
jgi:hypothetical protein